LAGHRRQVEAGADLEEEAEVLREEGLDAGGEADGLVELGAPVGGRDGVGGGARSKSSKAARDATGPETTHEVAVRWMATASSGESKGRVSASERATEVMAPGASDIIRRLRSATRVSAASRAKMPAG
jgi:hypothetical protein